MLPPNWIATLKSTGARAHSSARPPKTIPDKSAQKQQRLSICPTTLNHYRGIVPAPQSDAERLFHPRESFSLQTASAWRAIKACPFPPVCSEEICNPGGKGELLVGRRGHGVRLVYPAAPSLVVCVEVFCFCFFFASSCALLHPSMFSQCHFSPRDTLCPPQSHGGAPCGSP